MQKLKHQSFSSIATGQMGAPVYNSNAESSRRPGMPPSHPNNPQVMLASRSSSNVNPNANVRPSSSHYRSLSQSGVYDLLPPLSPTTPLINNYQRESPSVVGADQSFMTNVSVEERAGNSHGLSAPSPVSRVGVPMVGENLPPRKGHRRSISDTPLGFSAMIQSSPQLMPIGSRGLLDVSFSVGESSGSQKTNQLVQGDSGWNDKDGRDNVEGMREKKSEGEFVDDLISAYMNLDNVDTLNSSGTEDKDLDSRASGTKTNGAESSDNEVESGLIRNSMGVHGAGSSVSNERREGVKRSAGGDIASSSRHFRSVSMDSYMENFDFDDDTARLPLQTQTDQLSPGSPIDDSVARLSLELNGEFHESDLKKILANDKLIEIALSDPKRARRILANRQSAARSKQRKTQYIAELEHKVQTLQTETTTLSAQYTVLQRDSADVASQNNELKFRLQAMEQQAQLKDALNEALAAEVQRLKAVTGETHLANCMAQQLSINNQVLQVQNQQSNPHNVYQLQQQQHYHQQRQQQHHQQQHQHPQPNQMQPNGQTAVSK